MTRPTRAAFTANLFRQYSMGLVRMARVERHGHQGLRVRCCTLRIAAMVRTDAVAAGLTPDPIEIIPNDGNAAYVVIYGFEGGRS